MMDGAQRKATNLRGVVSSAARSESQRLCDRLAELGLLESKRIHPHMVPAPGMLRKTLPRARTAEVDEMGQVWGGCVAEGGGKWSNVIGTWRIPTVKPGLDDAVGVDGWLLSHWVGLDGYGNGELLQCGVAQQIKSDGTKRLYPWYEWYIDPIPDGAPDYVHAQAIDNFDCEVHDTMCGAAEYFVGEDGVKRGRLTLANVTKGTHFSIELDPPSAAVTMPGKSAEWVVEVYNGGYAKGHSIAFFTPIPFTACSSESPTALGFPGAATVIEVTRNDGNEMTSMTPVNGDHFYANYYKYNID